MKPTGESVAAAAVQSVGVGYTYDEMDCQAFVEHCVRQAGGSMDYSGSNDMARNAVWLGTLENAKAAGKLVPGAGMLIHEDTEANLPAKYRGDAAGGCARSHRRHVERGTFLPRRRAGTEPVRTASGGDGGHAGRV